MDFITALLVSVPIVILGFFVLDRASKKSEDRLIAALNAVIDQLTPDFRNAGPSAIGKDESSCLLLAQETKRVCLIELSDDYETQHRIVGHRDLLEVELVQDGISITKTSRSSQAANALIGGAIFGGVGAVVGALTSTSVTSDKIKRIDLRLTVNDLDRPLFILNFLNSATNKGSSDAPGGSEGG